MNRFLEKQLQHAKQSSYELQGLTTSKKNAVLKTLAKLLVKESVHIIKANTKDFARLPKDYTLSDRLQLTPERIAAMADGVIALIALADPVGEIISQVTRPSGITVVQQRVPIGTLGVIYEARPNVTIEIFSLCMKTGNAVVLKGSRDAHHTNQYLVKIIKQALKINHITTEAVQLIDPFDRDLTTQLLQAQQYIDIAIPRGSERLIQLVRKIATVPVIETGAGVCHTFVERTANIAMAVKVVMNAKIRRCTVCNALDCLVVDKKIISKLLPQLAKALAIYNIVICADKESLEILKKYYPKKLLRLAHKNDYGKEFLSMQMSVKTVESFNEGLQFVQTHTSGHSEAIITENQKKAEVFTTMIDAAAVYVNTSTAFTDGFEFGLGAEVGISTQKLHARGPMGLLALTTYKWIVRSRGKTRS